jgi:hypothetical protein
MLMLYADIIPIDQNFLLPPTVNGVRLGPRSIAYDKDRSLAAYQRMRSIIGMAPFVSYIFTDVDLRYSLRGQWDRLEWAGSAAYRFWQNAPGGGIQLNAEVNRRLADEWPSLSQTNPPVYETVTNAGRWAAVLRSLRSQRPDEWQGLMAQVRAVEILREVETPIIYGAASR